MQIATERSDSCSDRRHANLLTAHSTFTQQTQYTDNMATLNERQLFLLVWVLAPVTYPTARALGSGLCTLCGQDEVARGGR